jgi:hypothetical protein
MGKRMSELTSRLKDFISRQKLFFVATAMEEGRINLSPKGMDAFRVLDENTVLWLNLSGSGNETATHLRYSDRMTVMFCAFEDAPLILRLYGNARAYHPRDPYWDRHIGLFPPIPGSRQLIELKIDLIQTSCGMGVPLLEYQGERGQLDAWAAQLGEEGLRAYHEQKNTLSLDGHETGIFR